MVSVARPMAPASQNREPLCALLDPQKTLPAHLPVKSDGLDLFLPQAI